MTETKCYPGALTVAARLYERIDRDSENRHWQADLKKARLALRDEVAAVASETGKRFTIVNIGAGGNFDGVLLFFAKGMVSVAFHENGTVLIKVGSSAAITEGQGKPDGQAEVRLRWETRQWVTDVQDPEIIGNPGEEFPTMHPVKAIWKGIEEATRAAGW